MGAPMGIEVPIVAGGLFPEAASAAEATPDEVLAETFSGNHPSFSALDADGAGLDVVAGHVAAGFGKLFADRAAVERYLGPRVAPTPLNSSSK